VPSPEKYEMYCRYLVFQHAKAEEVTYGYDGFRRFLYMRHESSAEIEYWLDGYLIGITIADIIPGKVLSSVYHFLIWRVHDLQIICE
jgi:arginyl-tRNA--protein-N-Asp/Glu arginylyltransferase